MGFKWLIERLHNNQSSIITVIKTLKVTQLHFQVRSICKRIVRDTQAISKENFQLHKL